MQYLTYFHARGLNSATDFAVAHMLHKSRYVHNCN